MSTNIGGVSGRAILAALASGTTDPAVPAELARGACAASTTRWSRRWRARSGRTSGSCSPPSSTISPISTRSDELRTVNADAWQLAVRDAWDAYLSSDSLEAASTIDSLDGYGYCVDGCPLGSEDGGFDLVDECEHRLAAI